ncbi:MAG TPA: PLP-dependent aminotransferase family protein [Ktedonobacterales bacterium]
MLNQPFILELDRSQDAPPIYAQIRERLALLIRRGDLPAGTRLPPERQLADDLHINRTTVVRAYSDLAAAGLVHAHVGRGTVVQATEQGVAPQRNDQTPGSTASRAPAAFPWAAYLRESSPPIPGEVGSGGLSPLLQFNRPEFLEGDTVLADVVALCSRDDVISLAAGTPDPALYPVEDFLAHLGKQLRNDGARLLQHCPIEGLDSLRGSLARWLNQRWSELRQANNQVTPNAPDLEPDHVMILSGSQQGLWLAARALLAPGETVLVEMPTYLGALRVFAAAGLRVVGVPCDREGMLPEALRSALELYRPRLLYLLPTFQNPSGITTSLQRRQAILGLARRYHTPILEDDPYGELFYQDQPPPPLAALDQSGSVLYLGTCSKVLFPGVRLGWMVAPRPLIARLSALRQYIDLHANTPSQCALDGFLREGLFDLHLARSRETYRQKRDLFADALERSSRGLLRWQTPAGGYYLWCVLEGGLRAREVQDEAAKLGVAFVPGYAFYPGNGGEDHLRLNFTGPATETLEEGAKRLGTALERLARKARRQPQQVTLTARRPLV